MAQECVESSPVTIDEHITTEYEPLWRSCPECGKKYNVPYNFYQYCPEEISEINKTSQYTEHEKKLGYDAKSRKI